MRGRLLAANEHVDSLTRVERAGDTMEPLRPKQLWTVEFCRCYACLGAVGRGGRGSAQPLYPVTATWAPDAWRLARGRGARLIGFHYGPW